MATLDKALRADWLVGLTNWLHNNSECDDGPNGDECCAPCYDLAMRLGRIANRAWGGDLEVVADPTLEVDEIFELGAAVLNRENYSTEIAALLRAAATEVEQEKPQ